MAAKIINLPDALVQQAIDGMLMGSTHLARLDGFPDIKVVVHKGHDKNKVAVISGGGSGHEPAHAGYVGPGMLTAAVAGEVFASPGTDAVLAAIRTVTGPAGCLLVVKNYTGDRLNFGLAAEQAKAEGYKVEMVVVGEDVAIDQPGLAGRRGLAGTVLVHKVAGAVAASGASLEAVTAAAQQAADSLATLGVALRVCTLPGKQPSDRLKDGEVEIGLGIHGEPGYEKAPLMSAQALVQRMLHQIATSHFFNLQAGERVVLLVNNLGATTPLEIGCVAREALIHLRETYRVDVVRCLSGPFMTSLDMAGMSLTLMRLASGPQGDATLAYLDMPVGAAGWTHTSAVAQAQPCLLPVPQENGSPSCVLDEAAASPANRAGAALLGQVIRHVADALVAAGDDLNALDAKVGDGDCGDTVRTAARAILAQLDAGSLPLYDPAATIMGLARSVRHSVGGTSGALYDVGLTAAAAALKGCDSVGAAEWSSALASGAGAMCKYGGAQQGSRTMLDALLPASQALHEAVNAGLGAVAAASAMAAAAQSGADATAGMVASAGRASYVPEAVLMSHPDPGAVAVAKWMAAVKDTLQAGA